ncbi:hypothetical protein ACVW1A_003676 [Bradyrhizobium sp. LB1.3]
MVGAGFAGASGGEATAGGGARDTAGAEAWAGSDATAPGFGARVSVSVPLRLPNT